MDGDAGISVSLKGEGDDGRIGGGLFRRNLDDDLLGGGSAARIEVSGSHAKSGVARRSFFPRSCWGVDARSANGSASGRIVEATDSALSCSEDS